MSMRHSIRSAVPGSSHSSPQTIRSIGSSVSAAREERPEKAVLVAVLLPNTKADLRDPLGELASLAESADVEVVASTIQKRMRLTAASAVGKGKLAEIGELVEDTGADVVIFDNELAPRQIRRLEETLQCKILDRSELILDIFATRAQTREAQLQVELAQLEYTAPRLRGMWTHLERIAGAGGGTTAGAVGGVGTRGPGERQIEVDRRLVRKRIQFLKREIDEIDRRKQREVSARSDRFTVSLVGYTNSGKSTLLARLTQSKRFVADMLFATLDTKTVRWDMGDGLTVLLSDTVGFVRDLPHGLIASFRATLEETLHANLLLHVVDGSSPTAWHQLKVVEDVLDDLGCADLPRLTLLNKMDIPDDASVAELLGYRDVTPIHISAKTGEGMEALTAEVRRLALGEMAELTIRVPQADGKLLSEIERAADVRARQYVDQFVEMDIKINRAHLQQLRARYPKLDVIGGMPDDEQPAE